MKARCFSYLLSQASPSRTNIEKAHEQMKEKGFCKKGMARALFYELKEGS
jgi:hypothetical protein